MINTCCKHFSNSFTNFTNFSVCQLSFTQNFCYILCTRNFLSNDIISMSKRILIIEDEISIQQILSEPLKCEGYEIVVASDGLEGINIFHTQQFDLVLLDIML